MALKKALMIPGASMRDGLTAAFGNPVRREADGLSLAAAQPLQVICHRARSVKNLSRMAADMYVASTVPQSDDADAMTIELMA